VQDILGVSAAITDDARKRLELMLTGQLANGGAIPVIKPFTHKPGFEKAPPAEEYRSDDCLWFFNAVPAFVAETGDFDFYKKELHYAESKRLCSALSMRSSSSRAHGQARIPADFPPTGRLPPQRLQGESSSSHSAPLGLRVFRRRARLGEKKDAGGSSIATNSTRTSRNTAGTACGSSAIAQGHRVTYKDYGKECTSTPGVVGAFGAATTETGSERVQT
jgi:hypothetical protein